MVQPVCIQEIMYDNTLLQYRTMHWQIEIKYTIIKNITKDSSMNGLLSSVKLAVNAIVKFI